MMRTSFLALDPKGRVTLPEEVRTALGVEPGDLILLELTERGTFELVPAALVPKDQFWFHHPEMQVRVKQAELDLAEGRSTRTETPKGAQALLDELKQNGRSGGELCIGTYFEKLRASQKTPASRLRKIL